MESPQSIGNEQSRSTAIIPRLRRPSDVPFRGLTSREIDILRPVGEGEDLRAIADQLHVTYKTVADACLVIKRKLGLIRFQMCDKSSASPSANTNPY
jgi:DNA-binding NarL/FixJ family response regulator